MDMIYSWAQSFAWFSDYSGHGYIGQGEVFQNIRDFFEPVKRAEQERALSRSSQDGYRQSRFYRRTTRSTIAPRKYAGYKGGR